MRKKAKKSGKKGKKFTVFDYLLVLLRPFLFVFLLVPLLVTAGRLQPFLNFLIIGFFLGIFNKNRNLMIAEALLTVTIASFVWPMIINPKFFESTVLLSDPLLYGDVVIKTVFGDLIAFNFNLYIFQNLGQLKVFILGVLFVPLGYVLKHFFEKFYDLLINRFKIAFFLNGSVIFAVVILAVLLLYDLAIPYSFIRERVVQKEQPYQYAVDYCIYKRTYELMSDYGMTYYIALNQAVNEDARNVKSSEGWLLLTPLWVRQPYLFYFWRFLSSIHPLLILITAICLMFFGLLLVFLGFESRFFKGASIFPLALLYPFYYLSIGWIYLFAPELWASLFMLVSMGFLMCGRRIAGLIFAGFSMMSRIIFAGYHFITAGYLVLKSFIERKKFDTLKFSLTSLLFLVFPAVNYYLVKTSYSFILRGSSLVRGKPTIGFVGISLNPSIAGFTKSLTWVSNFLAYPYTLHLYYGTVILVVGALAFIVKVALSRKFQDEDIFGVVLVAYIFLFISSNHVCQYYNSVIFPLALILISTAFAGIFSIAENKG